MLKVLEEIFESGTIETGPGGEKIPMHSNTIKEQGLFLQKIYDEIQPQKSLEVGLAYGISALFILEKCRDYKRDNKCHIIIEPFSWGEAAIHNITKEGLDKYIDVRNDLSDVVIPSMYLKNERIQFAYIDTTKVFDTVLQDFYFIDKILDAGGVVIFDDATTGGINMVMRFINSLPHYQIMDKFGDSGVSKLYAVGERIFEILISLIPFKKKFMSNYNFKTSRQLGINFHCIAFKKLNNDARQWNWDLPF